MEQVLVLIKPEGMHKGIVGEVLSVFINSDLRLVGLKLVKPTRSLVQKHYALLKGKFFYNQIVDYLTGQFHKGAPVVALVLEGKEAVKKAREIAGATNPEEASPNSIRGKYGRITTKGLFENIVHVSSSNTEARREIVLWFKKSEIL
jgi:nucleoside-diphosphate kinase